MQSSEDGVRAPGISGQRQPWRRMLAPPPAAEAQQTAAPSRLNPSASSSLPLKHFVHSCPILADPCQIDHLRQLRVTDGQADV